MSDDLYRLGEADQLKPGSRVVVRWNDGVVFRCPCDDRQVYVASPPHTITFSEDGTLTLDGSVGSRADESRERASNWCHFHIKQGVQAMCSGVQCPGARL